MCPTATNFRVKDLHKARAFDYYRRLADNYDHSVSSGPLRFLRRRERSAVLGLADFQQGHTLLDVGCGGGFYSLNAKAAGMRVTAADIVPEMIERLRGKVDEQLLLDIEAGRSPLQRAFDRVICTGVLDFVLDPERAFLNLCQWVTPEGKLVILVPRVGWGGKYYRLEKKLFGIEVNLFTCEWLDQIAQRAGMRRVARINPLPNNMALLYQSSTLKRKSETVR
jgi:2-polyprenyl-3-methyl-5-hydroxy-6-metoxy-1,4-benzoquinol methylase